MNFISVSARIPRPNLLNYEINPYFKHWIGNNIFYCKGKCISGPGLKKGACSLLFITAYTANAVVTISNNMSFSIAKVIVIVFFFLSSVMFYLLTMFSNPGLMPKVYYSGQELVNFMLFSTKVKFYHLKGRMFKQKYCYSCFIFRPIGTSHCHECNDCVERYDHHCPWIGNCIGKNNYQKFFIFITNINILVFLILGFCIEKSYIYIRITNQAEDFSDFIRKDPQTFIQILFSVIMIFFITTLLIYHIVLIINNNSTYVKIKQSRLLKITGNPFSKGSLLKNCYNSLRFYREERVDFQELVHVRTPVERQFIKSQTFQNCEYISDQIISISQNQAESYESQNVLKIECQIDNKFEKSKSSIQEEEKKSSDLQDELNNLHIQKSNQSCTIKLKLTMDINNGKKRKIPTSSNSIRKLRKKKKNGKFKMRFDSEQSEMSLN